MAQKKVRLILLIGPNVYSGGYHLNLRAVYCERNDTTLKEWNNALKEVWPQIDDLIKSGDLNREQKPKESFIRKQVKTKWKIFKRDGFTCKICGIQEDLEVDHIKPVSKGGNNDLDNLQTLCKHCNVKKSNKYVSKKND